MKVYALPKELAFDDPDFRNYDADKERDRETEHLAKVKDWLIKNGYTGKYTGEELAEPHADGYARYLLADGRKSYLIHLPYGDAWDNPNVRYLPKREVIKRIEARKRINALFAEKRKERENA
jgi:hypothetical protein